MTDLADLARLRLCVASGRPPDVRHLGGTAAAAVDVAMRLGAPLDPVLDAVTDAARADREVADEIGAALAPVRSVAMALAALPLVLVPLLGRLVDMDLAGFYATSMGRLVGLVVGLLWLVGVMGVAAVVRSAGRTGGRGGLVPVAVGVGAALIVHPLVGLVIGVVMWRRRPPAAVRGLAPCLELAAIATSAGLPLGMALREAAAVAGPPGDVPARGSVAASRGSWRRRSPEPDLSSALRRLAMQIDLGRPVPDSGGPWGRVAALVSDLATSGGPPTAALRLTAAQVRVEERAAARQEAARLPSRLTFPTVLGLLPATVLAIGAPLVTTGLDALGT